MSDYHSYFGISSVASLPIKRNYDDVVFIQILSENLDFISNELKIGQVKIFFLLKKKINKIKGNTAKSAFGKTIPIFGEYRFKILECIEYCFKINTEIINKKFEESETIPLIIVRIFYFFYLYLIKNPFFLLEFIFFA